ncbi:MFS transporter [Microbispora rosea subsp. aerata]|nr:MFS transporter [Microbispora rosea]GGO12880.1 MFS transporter [Microbispora rosea subsp. aerata]GIH54153.1 MFS transporter [Microbispora rosea subsp. aerata]GLJ85127.1 MFS transporter [Microbispora rosea subsp. aerata]
MYALLFADNGLSPAQISSLFVIWSVTGFVLEVPSGVWADLVSRRWLLAVAPLLTGAGFALWTFSPSYWSFALGFVLWGAGGSLRSGTLQALVYEELARHGATDRFPTLIGRASALGTTAVMAATALAGPVLAMGGMRAAGLASVLVTLLGAAVGLSFPESRGDRDRSAAADGYFAVLRHGLSEVRRGPAVRRAIVVLSAMSVAEAMDEYVPLLAEATGVPTDRVPLLVLLVSAGGMIGGWFAGRGRGGLAPALVTAAVCMAAGAVAAGTGRPEALALVAVAFGLFEWAAAMLEARLQEGISDGARATVTSMAGIGTEVVALSVYGGYAAGSGWAGPGPLFAVAAVPYLVIAFAVRGKRT